MPALDWLIVALYGILSLAVGGFLFRRAGGSVKSFFLAERNLPWWLVGFSSAATYTGAATAPVFTMLVFQDGLIGNWWWLLSFAVWMPLVAVLWSKFWRRLAITTTAEFMESRFSGSTARLFRRIYALYMSLGWAVLLNAYAIRWLTRALGPIVRWPDLSLFVFALGIVLVYCVVSGLYGVAYTDVVQFAIFLAANGLLIPVILHRAGGWGAVVQAAYVQRGAGFFHSLPPQGEIAGMTLLFLLIQGLFFASSPAGGEGYTAQRFMAARNEFHAQAGQMFSALLTLIVRIVPFLFLGIIGAALLPAASTVPDNVWGILIGRFSFPGLTGILVAGELAAFMSTVSTHVNWGGSFLVHDLYRPLIRKNASERHYVLIGRLASAVILVLSGLFGYFYVNRMMAWFLFINSVAIAFVLPLSWLRFFWWRHNIFGEGAALVLGLPLSYAVWFPLGFSDPSRHPYWHGFLLLFGLGWAVTVLADLLTPPERPDKLREFFLRCRPPGFWGPVRRSIPGGEREDILAENFRDLLDCVLSVMFLLGAVASLTSLFGRHYSLSAAAFSLSAACGTAFFIRWKNRGVFAGLSRKS